MSPSFYPVTLNMIPSYSPDPYRCSTGSVSLASLHRPEQIT